MGLDQRRAPTPREMEEMKACVDEAMGLRGLGPFHGPGLSSSAYADPAEIIELMCHAGRQGGMYFTHWKRTGVRVGTPEKPNKLAAS